MSENPTQTVTVETLPVITHQDVRVITTDLLAQLYGADAENVRNNFLRNQDRFSAGKHFFKLEGEALKEFKSLHKPSFSGLVEISPRAKHLTLWTERGAARHAKMLDTDQAWEVFEKLEEAYFGQAKDKPAETLTPSEQQLMHEAVDAKAAGYPADQQGKARKEIWSRVHAKFRVAKYNQIPRMRLMEAILYVTQMDLCCAPRQAPVPAQIETISPTQLDELAKLIRDAFNSWVFGFGSSSYTPHAYNRLRTHFNLSQVTDLPAADFEKARTVVAQIHEMNDQFLDWITEIKDTYLKDYVLAGAPWTPHLKSAWKKQMKTTLPAPPDWIAIQQQLQPKQLDLIAG